jgi:hypothetical protein
MPDIERISVTRRIHAPAAVIFAEVSRPAGHVRIDGSGMLVAAPDAKPVTRIGDRHKARAAGRYPLIPETTLASTLQRLEAVVTGKA